MKNIVFFNSAILIIFFFVFFLTQTAAALTLNSKDVIKKTYDQSPKGQSLKLDPALSRADIKIAKSQYDLNFAANFNYNQDKTQRASTIFGTETTTTEFEASLNQLTPLGTELKLSFENVRESNNSPFFTTNKYYDSRFGMSATQPLLKNSLGFATRNAVATAKKQHESVQDLTDSKLQELVYQNLNLYWNWYRQSHLVKIHSEAVSLANKLYETNQTKLKMGLIEDPDLHAFAANLNLKKNDFFTVKSQKARSENILQAALNLSGEENLQPGTEFFQKENYPEMSTLLAETLKTHPLLLSLKKDLKARNIQIATQKNSRLPQLDLTASLAANGLDASYSQALANIDEFHPVWSTGINLSVPLQNRSSRYGLKKLEIEKKQKLLDLKEKENQVMALIRENLENYENSLQKVHVTKEAVFHQQKKWEGEIARYEQGRSDPDTVIRYQNDYLEAQMAHLNAKVEFSLIKINLAYARGVLGKD